MQTIGAFQAKTHFSSILDQVEKGDSVIITRHGRAIARLIPVTGSDREKIKLTIQRVKQLSQRNTLNGLDGKTLRDEGRR